ncbi:MAG: hypothetical protein LBL24_02440, partial [Bacteroidales bacterium]|nr:hypothetical protein [Bacteroidales bacterium]
IRLFHFSSWGLNLNFQPLALWRQDLPKCLPASGCKSETFCARFARQGIHSNRINAETISVFGEIPSGMPCR